MNLLSYLVPALRDVRAPLIGGYLWLLLGWLWVADLVPRQDDLEPGSALAALSRLYDFVGQPGLVVALSVAAYLVGSLVGEFVNLILRSLRSFGAAGIDTEHLRAVVAAMPQYEHVTDRAERLGAEAELRFHVALPLGGVSLLLVAQGEDVRTLLVMGLFAVAMCTQTMMLLRRVGNVIAWLERAVAEREAEMSEVERRQNMANVRVMPMGRSTLEIRNYGPKTAYNVDVTLPDGSTPSFLYREGFLPIPQLPEGDEAEVPVTTDGDLEVDLDVSWVDPSGRQTNRETVRWPGSPSGA